MIYINISKRKLDKKLLTLYFQLLQKSNVRKDVKS